ncbi:endonuclease/exonuclease/phosphatase family protein [Microbacterium sp. CFBP9034]|uniref:endonuclease/exonuclease/phosphatase family protein n=1 Tax=Microbacterium sp. CFBP9034 TaxID=3096540 RepID=UPI002A69A7EA|nr:endonuclease/exonuclease/phosphatase family protein [Microbacterium sp. CFBP9034]MDY0909630.1 endonuclease/exonuclease/phosphatase family protein [Microbacterium sp. CFBP9034]
MGTNYSGITRLVDDDAAAGKRCADRVLAMRTTLRPLRERRDDSRLLLATWNIRDFDSGKFGMGPRLPESFYYIAEMLSGFDLIAVQEVSRDLAPLHRVLDILGRDWDFIATDITEGRGGNGERMAFLFNRDRVRFRNIAGEIVLPEGQLVVGNSGAGADETDRGLQFARSPFLVSFASGWFTFSLCTVHIYFGDDTGAPLERRIAEIDRLAAFLAKRQDDAPRPAAGGVGNVENVIALGDFNVVSPQHGTMQALLRHGFEVPAAIDGSRIADRDHFYDQIATRVKDDRFQVTAGGIEAPFADVFRDEDLEVYRPYFEHTIPPGADDAGVRTAYRAWRTWQMSDHSPLWVEIRTDFADEYLRPIAER